MKKPKRCIVNDVFLHQIHHILSVQYTGTQKKYAIDSLKPMRQEKQDFIALAYINF